MSLKVDSEQLEEGKKAKLTIEISADELDKAIDRVYRRQKGRINIPGFRRGKAPRKIIEKMYGAEIFYEEAANSLISERYPEAYDESDLDIVSAPDVEVTQIESGKPFIFTAVVALRPEIRLADYKGVEVKRIDIEASEKDIDERIEQDRKTNSRMVTVEDEAKEGDSVLIDYEGFVDGKTFEGGTAEGYVLELGSNSFIPGFEDQLVGASAGDDVTVEVTFPDEYHAPDLAGEDATFIVKIHEVRRMDIPEIDEDYIEDIGFDSMDEYRADLKEQIEKERADEKRAAQEDEAIKKIADTSEMDVPEEMIETQLNSAVNDYANNMARSGISFSQYMQMTGMTLDRMKDQLRPETEDRVRASLVLEEIVKVEGLEATDEDVEKRLEETAENYHMSVEDLKKDLPESEIKSLRSQLAMEKAIEIIMDNLVEVEAAEDEVSEEE